jgi:hypothetical protein
MSIKRFFVFILVACAFRAQAQHAPVNDTVLKGSTIEVIQSYKPQVKMAPKPDWIPQLPPTDTAHPRFSYDIPQQTLYYTYSSLPLRPLALGKEVPPKTFPDYVKVGGGNLSTLYLDAGIGTIKGENYETAIHLHHISQQGTIKYEQSALSGIEADATLHQAKSDWHFGLSGERNQYGYYGGNQTITLNGDSAKQIFTSVKAIADFKSKEDSNSIISYHPAISASMYTAKMSTSESSFCINAPFTFKFDPAIDASIALLGAITNFSTSYGTTSVSVGNNFVELLPGIRLHTGQLAGHALLGLAYGRNDKGYLLPDVMAAYTIPDSKTTISAGWQALLRQNTYEQLTTENPYMTNNYAVKQTQSKEAYANLSLRTGDHFSVTARLSWWAYDSLPVFLNNTGDQKYFNVVYDDNLNAISFKAAIRYHAGNKWSLGISGDFYGFSGGTQKYVWGQPSSTFKGDFMINPVPKLTLTAYIALLGGIHTEDINNKVVTLNTIADIGGNGEYQIVSRLSAFVQLNNLLNQNYQRWMGYPAYGLNAYGGVRLKF